MKDCSIRVGEHSLRVVSTSPSALTVFKEIYKPFLSPELTESHLAIEIIDNYGLPFQDYNVTITEGVDKITFQRTDYLIEVNSAYTKATIKFHDELALKHAMMNLYSAFIVHNNWGLLIHSSCAVENRQAHIFSGHSGAGKSTAARLSLPRQLLSDEATILRISDHGVTVFDSPFRSELQAAGEPTTAPLATINLLYQALSNERVELKKGKALTQLIDKVFYWSYRPEETAKILKLLKVLIEQVPVYDLHFQKNNSFWELISSDELYMQAKL